MNLTQRRYNVLASNLLFLAFFLTIPFNYITKEGYFDPSLPPKVYMALLATTPLILGLYYLIRRGYWWAKGLFLVLYLSSLALSIESDINALAPALFVASSQTINLLQQSVLQIVVSVLIIISFFKRKPQVALAVEE